MYKDPISNLNTIQNNLAETLSIRFLLEIEKVLKVVFG